MSWVCATTMRVANCCSPRSRMFYRLLFVSRWSFCGSGLLTLLCDPLEIEYEADMFALSWLKSIYGESRAKKVYVGMLGSMEKYHLISQNDTFRGNLHSPQADLAAIEKLSEKCGSMKRPWSVISHRVMHWLAAMKFLHIHGWMTAYSHPPYSERLFQASLATDARS